MRRNHKHAATAVKGSLPIDGVCGRCGKYKTICNACGKTFCPNKHYKIHEVKQ